MWSKHKDFCITYNSLTSLLCFVRRLSFLYIVKAITVSKTSKFVVVTCEFYDPVL